MAAFPSPSDPGELQAQHRYHLLGPFYHLDPLEHHLHCPADDRLLPRPEREKEGRLGDEHVGRKNNSHSDNLDDYLPGL